MDEKFQKYFEFMNHKYFISMILDPRIKNRLLVKTSKLKTIETFNEVYRIYSKLNITNIDDVDNENVTKKAKKTLFTSLFPKEEANNNEIDIYLKESVINEESDILSYWDNNKTKYPILSRMARVYLCIASTSVRCE
jgi:hypothetical protein